MKTSDLKSAQSAVFDFLRAFAAKPQFADPGLALVNYLVDHGVARSALASDLTALYDQLHFPASLAVSLAQLLPADQSRQLLLDHLRVEPSDFAVYERLLHDDFAAPTAASAAQTLRTVASLIAASPAYATKYATTLMDQAGPTPLSDALALLTPAELAQPSFRYLKAMILLEANQDTQAQGELEQALKAQPDFDAVRILLAELLLDTNHLQDAQAVLEPLAPSTDARAVELRITLLKALGKQADAAAVLDQALMRDPANNDLIIAKADLQSDAGNLAAAEHTLLDALTAHPTAEPLYARLFHLYEKAYDNNPSDQSYLQKFNDLLGRARQSIPASRVTRYNIAVLLCKLNRFDEAQRGPPRHLEGRSQRL